MKGEAKVFRLVFLPLWTDILIADEFWWSNKTLKPHKVKYTSHSEELLNYSVPTKIPKTLAKVAKLVKVLAAVVHLSHVPMDKHHISVKLLNCVYNPKGVSVVSGKSHTEERSLRIGNRVGSSAIKPAVTIGIMAVKILSRDRKSHKTRNSVVCLSPLSIHSLLVPYMITFQTHWWS